MKSASLAQVIPLSLEIVTAIGAVVLITCLPLRDPDIPCDHICPVSDLPTLQLRTPEDNLTLWQFMTVSWMNPLISLGRARQLNDKDVWSLGFEFQHRGLHDAFRELHGTVVRRLLKANGLDLVITGFLGMFEMLASMVDDETNATYSISDAKYRLCRATTFAAIATIVGRSTLTSSCFYYLCRVVLTCTFDRKPVRCLQPLVQSSML